MDVNLETNDVKHLRSAVAHAVATRKVSDDVVDQLAKQLVASKHKIRGLDVCTHGICIDYFIKGDDWWKVLPEMINVDGGRLAGIEVFPWGIPFPDLLRVRVIQDMELLPQVR